MTDSNKNLQEKRENQFHDLGELSKIAIFEASFEEYIFQEKMRLYNESYEKLREDKENKDETQSWEGTLQDGLEALNPKRGEIWRFAPDPIIGNEIGDKLSLALIVSNNLMNSGPSGLIFIVPCTFGKKMNFSYIRIVPLNGGVNLPLYAICEQMHCVSKKQLQKKIDESDPLSLYEIKEWINIFMRSDQK